MGVAASSAARPFKPCSSSHTGGADRLVGERTDDCLFGGRGRDVLLGRRGWDLLEGGRGDDTLVGGADPDYLNGHSSLRPAVLLSTLTRWTSTQVLPTTATP